MDPFGLVGTVAFALAGYLVAVKKGLDLLGVLLLSGLTAVGGGVLRDVLLGQLPQIFSADVPFARSASAVVLLTVTCGWLLRIHRLEDARLRLVFQLADTLGLVAFALSGAEAALDAGVNATGVTLLALVSAVGGGLVRDALVNDVPTVLYEDFYGSVALLVGVAMASLPRFGIVPTSAAPYVFLGGVVLRLVALRFGWRLPRVR